jgi:hypothetical protein
VTERNAVKVPGGVEVLWTTDPRSLAIIKREADGKVPTTWQQFLSEVGWEIVKAAGGWAVGYLLDHITPPQAVPLTKAALIDIGNVVRDVVDDVFLEHYLEQIESIRFNLATYHDTGNRDVLMGAQNVCVDLIPHSRGYGTKALGGFIAATNYHLATILAFAEFDPSWRATYHRAKADYAGHGIGTANQIRDHIENRVGRCECSTTGSGREGTPRTRSCKLVVDGQIMGFGVDGDASTRADQDCVAAR